MAHFAQLDASDIVVQVIVVHDGDAPDEATGVAYLKNLYDNDTKWAQTSFNTRRNVHAQGKTPFRKNFAGIGYQFDRARNGFIPPKKYPSWVLNETEGDWDPPTPNPGAGYVWDESATSWVLG